MQKCCIDLKLTKEQLLNSPECTFIKELILQTVQNIKLKESLEYLLSIGMTPEEYEREWRKLDHG